MTVQLTQSDFQKLVCIAANTYDFRSVMGRLRLVSGALEGSPRATDILSQLNLDGTPRGAAVEVISRLSQFGRVTEDKEALGVFLNYVLFFKGEEDKDTAFIRSLFEIYHLDRPTVAARSIDSWRGAETAESVQEKIIGENTLRHINMLEMALEASKAIVHISSPSGMGTGFLIASDILMTNNHVINCPTTAGASTFTFNYQLDTEDKLRPTTAVPVLANGLFHTNSELDYTIVQLMDAPDFGTPLVLKPVRVHRDDRVTIIQHPGGHFKKISMQNNFVAYADNCVVQYTTSTMPGSSGSPVFNDDFQVVAIHHSGGMLQAPGTHRRYLRNAGTSMIAVLRDLKAYAGEIYARLSS